MTHYAQLAEAVEFSRGPDISLVLRGSHATLDDLVDRFLDDDLDELVKAHPAVSEYHVTQVADILADLLRDVPDEPSARRQLKKQAHWALLSEYVSRLIEKEADDLSDSPTREELLTLVRRVLARLQRQTETVAAGRAHRTRGAGRQSASRVPPGTPRNGSRESLQRIVAEITDCASTVRNTADQLQVHHAVHAAYARELATRLDELLVDLLPSDPEG